MTQKLSLQRNAHPLRSFSFCSNRRVAPLFLQRTCQLPAASAWKRRDCGTSASCTSQYSQGGSFGRAFREKEEVSDFCWTLQSLPVGVAKQLRRQLVFLHGKGCMPFFVFFTHVILRTFIRCFFFLFTFLSFPLSITLLFCVFSTLTV